MGSVLRLEMGTGVLKCWGGGRGCYSGVVL